MFSVIWLNYGELNTGSNDFSRLVYDVSRHQIFYETCSSIKHVLCCDFSPIFDKLRIILKSDEFQDEHPYSNGCDGDWYKFEYTRGSEQVSYEGYIYGLKQHEAIISLIQPCAKKELDDEQKLLNNNSKNMSLISEIQEHRLRLEEEFFDIWEDI